MQKYVLMEQKECKKIKFGRNIINSIEKYSLSCAERQGGDIFYDIYCHCTGEVNTLYLSVGTESNNVIDYQCMCFFLTFPPLCQILLTLNFVFDDEQKSKNK